MSTQTQNNVMSVLVGGNVPGTAIASITNDLANLAEGQIIAVGMRASTGAEEVLSTSATAALYPSIRLVAMNNGQLNYSARIFAKDVNTFKGIDGVAGTTEQVTIVGYNGSSGSSLDNSSTEYLLTYVGDWDDMMWSKQKYRKVYEYNTLSPTQKGIAQNLSANINLDGFRSNLQGVAPQVKCEVLCDGSAAFTASGSATTLTVVNGSNIATLDAVDTGVQALGAILRIDEANAAITTGIPVYVVIGTPSTDSTLSSTQVRLHTYYQGTGVASTLGTGSGIVSTATNWGLKFTGKPLTWGLPPYSDFKFNKVTFHFDLKGFGASTVSNPTLASRGQGDYREVAEFEYFAQGNEGALNRTVIPLPTGRHYTDTTGSISAYDTIVIESADTQRASAITRQAAMRIQTFVFIPDGAANATKLLTQLNPWMASSPISLPNVSV